MSVDEIFQTMRDLVSEQFAMEPAEVTMDTSFEEDLGADSVDLVELVMAIDPNAFVIVQEAHQVLGDGFSHYSKQSL